ncbi:TPA: diadenosine tetraphosphatase [Vibrio vulnificus]|nr:diadenosine tetraphosphatase [Vibrio vulnificus]
MEFMHRFIDGSRYQRIFVIGDIHGKLALLQDTLKRVDFHGERDLLISVGDLIDRGPDSVGVLDYYQTHHWFEAVMGNHEWMMVNALDAQNKLERSEKEAYFIKIWHRNGCEWSQNLTDADKQRLRDAVAQLPSVITVELEDGRRFGISHAQPHSLDWNEMIDWQGDMWDNPRSKGVKRVANSLFIDTASNDDYQGAFSLYELRTGEVFVGVKQSVLV